MHKRKWPEIIKAVAKPDFSVDVTFEDGKIVTVDLHLLRDRFQNAEEFMLKSYSTELHCYSLELGGTLF